MIFILVSYQLAFIMELPFKFTLMDILRPLNEALTQGLLYYFVFEMLRLRDKLESDTFEEHLLRQRKTLLAKRLVFAIFAFTHVIISYSSRILMQAYPQYSASNKPLFDGIAVAKTVGRVSLDLFMAFSFWRVFRYLVERKKQSLRGE